MTAGGLLPGIDIGPLEPPGLDGKSAGRPAPTTPLVGATPLPGTAREFGKEFGKGFGRSPVLADDRAELEALKLDPRGVPVPPKEAAPPKAGCEAGGA